MPLLVFLRMLFIAFDSLISLVFSMNFALFDKMLLENKGAK